MLQDKLDGVYEVLEQGESITIELRVEEIVLILSLILDIPLRQLMKYYQPLVSFLEKIQAAGVK